MSTRNASVATATSPAGRTATSAFIALIVTVQLLLPLRYYSGLSGNDERFSWRMFSSLRTRDRYVEVTETLSANGAGIERRVPLQRLLHPAWIGGLTRFDPQVVAKFLRWYARRSEASRIRCVLHRRLPDGTRLPAKAMVLDCQRGTLRAVGDHSS